MPTHDLPDGVPFDDDGFEGEFRREADLLRSLGRDRIEFVDAPAGLWDRIAEAAEQDADPVGEVRPIADVDAADVEPHRRRDAGTSYARRRASAWPPRWLRS